MRKLFLFLPLLFLSCTANAKDFYIAQNSAQSTGGAGCDAAMSVAWFNSTDSWGPGPNQISPGATVHLCGAFTGSAGQQLLTFHGSGTSGNPITLKFEPGVVLTAPYWSAFGAINANGVSNITIDGGGSGIIQNTANGTVLGNKQDSRAIYAPNCTGCTVQNLVIANIYVHTADVSDSQVTQTNVNCIHFVNSNNFTINNVTCHDAGWAFAGCGNNFTLKNSEIYNIDHGLAFGAGGTTSGFQVFGNHIHDFTNWDTTSNSYHHDGLHFWGQSGGTVTNGSIYNNLFDGDSGVNITGDIYLQDSIQNVSVYNNVFIVPSNRNNNVIWFEARSTTMQGGPATGNSAYNNFVSAGTHQHGTALYINAQLNFTAVNNILIGGQSDITIQGGGSLSAVGINNNVYLELADMGDRNTFGFQTHVLQALSDWQSACHCDSNSKIVSISKIDVDGLGQLQAGSVAIGAGANLMAIASGNLASLAQDRLGESRPSTGAWDIGPYQTGAQTAARPKPPTALNGVVH